MAKTNKNRKNMISFFINTEDENDANIRALIKIASLVLDYKEGKDYISDTRLPKLAKADIPYYLVFEYEVGKTLRIYGKAGSDNIANNMQEYTYEEVLEALLNDTIPTRIELDLEDQDCNAIIMGSTVQIGDFKLTAEHIKKIAQGMDKLTAIKAKPRPTTQERRLDPTL